MAAMPPALATPEQAPQTTPRATPERPPQPALRGTAPSSLQAQARRLERGEQAVVPAGAAAREEPRPLEPRRMAAAGAAPMLHLNGPATAPTPAPDAAASVVIQIGAFASEAEARRQLASARERAGSMLETASPVTQPVQVSGRSLFRARFTGLSPGAAASTCTELRRGGIDCLVAPAN
jgi:D-alanyl-D-alanine carboxypeptidase